jgi:PHD/YefM family antitoxin component YafN of YafNO toxin-antitoxin module
MAKITKPKPDRRFSKTVTATELANRSGDVLLDSERGPIGVLRHGKPRYVVLNIEAYETLKRAGDPQRAYRTKDAPPELLNAILESMRADVDGSGDDADSPHGA